MEYAVPMQLDLQAAAAVECEPSLSAEVGAGPQGRSAPKRKRWWYFVLLQGGRGLTLAADAHGLEAQAQVYKVTTPHTMSRSENYVKCAPFHPIFG